jgi:HEPN domain-containing protein
MKPPESEIRRLVAGWLDKAELDFKTVTRLAGEDEFRDVVAFHAQQAVEKYLKALLTFHQIESPKTHIINRLLILLQPVEPALAVALDEANWLSPFGAELRYPGDRAETMPGDELRALELARLVRGLVLQAVGGESPSGMAPRS